MGDSKDKPPDSLRRAIIIGTGSYVPPRRMTNTDLERIVNTSDEWTEYMKTLFRGKNLYKTLLLVFLIVITALRIFYSQSIELFFLEELKLKNSMISRITTQQSSSLRSATTPWITPKFF